MYVDCPNIAVTNTNIRDISHLCKYQLIISFPIIFLTDKNKNSKPTIVQLAKGSVDEAQVKGHELCLKLTSTIQGDRSVYLAFADEATYSKWIRKAKKVNILIFSK